jgi:DNA-binding transcriptional regulator YiaG
MVFAFLLIACFSGYSQSFEKLTIKGEYSESDSIQIVKAYLLAKESVERMYQAMITIRDVETSNSNQSINDLRKEKWMSNDAFNRWLGSSDQMKKSFRRIKGIHDKFNKNITLQVIKKNKGRCKGWISAWTLPHGTIKIRLCEDFFMYRTHLQEKVLVHEIGHESGLLSHHKIHGCRAALKAADLPNSNLAKRSTENYAWLAMSYFDLECISR